MSFRGQGVRVRSGFGCGVAALTARVGGLALGFLVAVTAPPLAAQDTAIIETVAGTGTFGNTGDRGPATAADVQEPWGVAVDASGNLYIANSSFIRRVDAATGNIFQFAGTLTNPWYVNNARFLFVDSSNNLYLANASRGQVVRGNLGDGTAMRVAGDSSGFGGYSGDGGPATSARVNGPSDAVADASGNLYIADTSNNRIRRVDTAGVITTFAGTGSGGYSGDGGQASAAQISNPIGLALDASGNLYIADAWNVAIRKIDTAGVITTFAGTPQSGGYSGDGGPATMAQIDNPHDLVFDSKGNLYIADANNHVVRRVDTDGVITTVAGTGSGGYSGDGGAPTEAELNSPRGLAVDSSDNLYISDHNNHRIRKVTFPPPPSPPPPDYPPVAVGTFADVALDPGERLEVSLSGKFRDPEVRALTYSAESANPEVASAVVSEGRLWVEGRSPGLVTVVVKAVDSGGQSAQLAFQVTVGRVLTFAAASAAAPEGGLARLRVELTRPAEQAVSVGYVLESDGDPATADADAADHGGSDGTLTLAAGETEAFIEVPILDDDDVEPAREFLRVRLLAPAAEADWALGLAAASVVIQEGVCDRTPAVRDALRGSRDCWAPSVAELAGTGYLNLGRQGIGSLRAGDLLGLSGLRVLHLHGNRLAELPGGLFAGLGSLERLRLEGNRLWQLSEGLLLGLGRLSSLDLGGNRLSSLSAGLLAGVPALSRLDLGNNRLSDLPAGFFEGASNLAELDLSGNPGAPFTLTMELTRTDAEAHAPGPATVAARVAEGTPFALSAGLVAESAELSADMAAIDAGKVSGAPIQVSLTEGGAALLSLSGAPEAPSQLCGEVDEGRYPCFQGLAVEAGPSLLLFKRPPWVVRAVPEQGVESLGGPLSLNLAGLFAADGGDALTYSTESSNPALASVRVSGGVLSIEPNGEGLDGLVTVRVTATDSDGLEAEQSFTVEVSPPSRRFSRGWRLGLLVGAAAPTEAAPPQAGPR